MAGNNTFGLVDLSGLYDPIPARTELPDTVGFWEGVGAHAKQYTRSVYRGIQHLDAFEDDPDFNVAEAVGDEWAGYYDTLYGARSADELAYLQEAIIWKAQNDETLANESWASFGVGMILDPVNLILIPLGGPLLTGAVKGVAGIGKFALKTGLYSGATQAGMEAARLAFDPASTSEEAMSNIAVTALFGAGLGAAGGGLVNVKLRRTGNAVQQVRAAARHAIDLRSLGGVTADELANFSIANRRGETDAVLESMNEILTKEFDALNRRVSEVGELEAQPLLGLMDSKAIELRDVRLERVVRKLESEGFDFNDAFKLTPSFFTDSFLFKMIPTPIREVLSTDFAPNWMKSDMVKITGDYGLEQTLNRYGIPTEASVYQLAKLHDGVHARLNEDLMDIWRDEFGVAEKKIININVETENLRRRAVNFFGGDADDFDNWSAKIMKKRQLSQTDLTATEAKFIRRVDQYFEDIEVQLVDNNLIGNRKAMSRRSDEVSVLRKANLEKEKLLNGKPDTPINRGLLEKVRAYGKALADEAEYLSLNLAVRGAGNSTKRPEPFFPRFWNHAYIRKNRDALKLIISDWYNENPYVWEFDADTKKWVQKMLSTDPEDIAKRADDTIDSIMMDEKVLEPDNIFFGMGRSKHFKGRNIDIPNSKVWDFIHQDPNTVVRSYNSRMAPRLEFQKKFGDKAENVQAKMRIRLAEEGLNDEQINELMMQWQHSYERIAGVVVKDPTALNQKIAYTLREAASATYMGRAGLSAIPDFARIMMEHDMENVIKGIGVILDANKLKLSGTEVKLAGEAIDMLKLTAHLKLNDTSNMIDPKIWSEMRGAFYILNGLAPLTDIAKMLDGIVRQHTLIDYSKKLASGAASDFETRYLAKNGVGTELAEFIANAPVRQLSKGGLWTANTDAWVGSRQIKIPDGVRVLEINEDGSRVGKMKGDRYVPTFHRDGTIHFDRDYIMSQFDDKPWTKPKVAGVQALPKNAFKTPQEWADFVLLHELEHTFYSKKAFLKTVRGPKELQAKDVPLTAESYYGDAASKGKYFDDPLFAQEAALEAPKKGATPKEIASYGNQINIRALRKFNEAKKYDETMVENFRVSLSSGILNTIMAATPADRPKLADGVVYIKMKFASKLGMKEDPVYKGYARIENGLLGLPFQFYSYSLANVAKTAGGMAQGQVKNRTVALATMMGLGYMTTQLRTPDYIWDQMGWRDRFARSFDNSGILALYSNMAYDAMQTTMAFGGPNITGGFFSPKYNVEKDVAGAITNITGAGTGWAYDVGGGLVDVARGEVGEGMKTLVGNAPFTNLWLWKNFMREQTRAWGQ